MFMSEPKYFVYILHCPETDLTYVGQTDNLILRYYRHRDKQSRWTSRMQSALGYLSRSNVGAPR
ncbi:MAG: GIY-YIG nuclease family protein [Kiritimatiellaeota bacterium]|nr:GIY-YIG nuclease family protein [Kiritimatiellota bacterium]